MSDMYAIKATTLTALGDAVRLKTFGDYSQATAYSMAPNTIKYINTEYDYTKLVVTFVEKSRNDATLLIKPVTNGDPIYYDENYPIGIPFERIVVGKQQVQLSTLYGDIDYTLQMIPVDENGNEFMYTPLEMADAIEDFDTQSGQHFRTLIEAHQNSLTITAEDLAGITRICSYAFYMQSQLTNIEFPDTLTRIENHAFAGTKLTHVDLPASVGALGTQAFYSCTNLKTAKIWNTTSKVSIEGSTWSKDMDVIYVPSNLYQDYLDDGNWRTYPIQPWGEWVFKPDVNAALVFNQSKEFTIELSEFDSTPQVSIVSSNPAVATVSDVTINTDNTAITYRVNALTTEGNATITITIVGNVNTYEYSGDILVWETIPESTYEVVAVDGASYGFALNDAGYWESQNKGQGGKVALCQINISNVAGRKLYLDCINYAEANYDYGILGAVNQTLGTTSLDDSGVKQSFKGLSKADIQTVEYSDATGNCSIQVKFRKDGSGDNNNDTLQFKVRFGE